MNATDWKPAKRKVDPGAEPYDDTPLREWWCPGCNRFEFERLSAHHVLNRSQGGDDVPENLIYICGHGTSGCHGVVHGHGRGAHGLSYNQVAANLLRYVKTLEPVVGYVERKKWPGWLEEHMSPTKGTERSDEQSALGSSP